MKKHRISGVEPGSIAEELELKAGDAVLTVNGQEIEDVFDYEFLCRDEELTLLAETAEGEEVLFEIEKDEDEDLGLQFENGLMDDYRSCRNKCIFCFIDQMPPGMRDTLYFKDDDSRLSFLQGNYVTLTNLDDRDIDRIIRYRLEPINISVHTMNPELRCEMLHNRFAGEALKKLDRLYEAGISMNGQLVLCPGINDGEELERSIRELTRYLPVMESVSVVPVGLTKYREGLPKLRLYTAEEAAAVIDCVEAWQKKLFPKHGLHFIHASDEFYLLAGRSLPEEERYDEYRQLENGVGMLTLLKTEFLEELRTIQGRLKPEEVKPRRVTVATGQLAAPFLKELTDRLTEPYPQLKPEIRAIRNDFFGEGVTVAGLITGQDLCAQLKGKELGEALYIPESMLRAGEEVFLDDLSLQDAEDALGIPVIPLECDGSTLVNALLGLEGPDRPREFRPYEPKRS